MKSMVVFIGAGPGDPELITVKGKKFLEKADVVVYAGSLLNPEILRYAKAEAEFYDSAKMDRTEVFKVMTDAVRAGKLVARVHDGDPSFFGALQEQLDYLEKEKIPYMIIPGVSCLQAGAASLKRELTLPSVSQTVIITRPEGRTPVPKNQSIKELAKHKATMAVFLGLQQVEAVISELREGGYTEDTPACVVYKASWTDEKIVRGTLADIAAKVKGAGITETALIYVGKVFSPTSYEYSKLYDPAFTHGFRKGKN